MELLIALLPVIAGVAVMIGLVAFNRARVRRLRAKGPIKPGEVGGDGWSYPGDDEPPRRR